MRIPRFDMQPEQLHDGRMESQTCQTCKTSALILTRSIEDTFWCGKCQRWMPCEPPAVWKRGGIAGLDLRSS